MRVLIVEDDRVSAIVIGEIMEPFGRSDHAENGRIAVEKFERALGEGDPYDLVLLDIMTPEMDGYQALARIRAVESKRNIWGSDAVKIVMVTALGDFESVKLSFREQCDGYLVKPIRREKVVALLRELELVSA